MKPAALSPIQASAIRVRSSNVFRSELQERYPLTPDNVRFFKDNGFIKLKHVLSREALEFYAQVISDQVQLLNTQHEPLEKRDTYGRAFLQVMNIWQKNAIVRDLVFSKKLARLAAELLEVSGVRLYHDQALYKEAGGGMTPWHADQFYWPVDTNNTITAWIPFQDTPVKMGPLAFAPRSHRIKVGRDLAISNESEDLICKTLHELKMDVVETAYELGEVSFHRGWNWHHAGANTTDQPRRVMTIIYLEEDARLIKPKHKNHQLDWEAWMPGVQVGQVINSPMNPVLWSQRP